MRRVHLVVFVSALIAFILAIVEIHAQTRSRHRISPPEKIDRGAERPVPIPAAVQVAPPAVEVAPSRPAAITTAIRLADIGFAEGFRFANLGGRREFFVQVPQGADITATELVLAIDDVTAHDARRSLEVLLNDRSVAAMPLDGKGSSRSLRIPLGNAKPRDGFLKFTFLYSGAATPDRCIDVRYVGDSLTIRPETAVTLDITFAGLPDVATVAALMPREVAVVLPRRRLAPAEIATALTVARWLAASGRQAKFHHGFDILRALVKREDQRAWMRGIVIVGTLQEVINDLDRPVATFAGPGPEFGALIAVRVGGLPALLVSDAASVPAGRLLASPNLAATRGATAASVSAVAPAKLPTDLVNLDRLGVLLPEADVFGRAALPLTIDTRALPAGTTPSRLVLDVMVAPDGTGERAVVSAYINDHLVDSVVAVTGARTRLDIPLPDGMIGTTASVRALVQRRSAQGDCRFEPQGYPAQILGSSALVLKSAGPQVRDFSALVPHWVNGLDIVLPQMVAEQPLTVLGLVAEVLNVLAAELAPLQVHLVAPGATYEPAGPFIVVSDVAPAGIAPRVRFDRGRVVVADRTGRTMLDLGGLTNGAVAQVVIAGNHAGLWLKSLAADRSLPTPTRLKLDRGDIAFLDETGVALAMSTERDTLIRVSYPDQMSWLTIADRFRKWIIGGLWVLATIAFLVVLQRLLRRRRPARTGE
jgi:hypothetical protein